MDYPRPDTVKPRLPVWFRRGRPRVSLVLPPTTTQDTGGGASHGHQRTKNVHHTLRDLIEVNRDAEKGFEESAEKMDDTSAASTFRQFTEVKEAHDRVRALRDATA